MGPRAVSVCLVAIALCAGACGCDQPEEVVSGGRPLIEGLGDYTMPITTRSPLAQQYFDQGLRLVYGFNHPEAVRAFEVAGQIDPGCTMCSWGVALALGPNINAPMEPGAVAPAIAALEKAQARALLSTPRELAYVAALAKRYSSAPDADRAALDRDYADAMRAVAKRFPDDLDAQTLAAEAVMDLSPWDYWTKAGEPKQTTDEIVSLLESVLERNPDHPGANHYYIHAVEASRDPGRALPSAKRLETLAVSAGHLVHMSAHTFMRVGLYRDASIANERGAQADEAYMAWCRSGGIYPGIYYPHNLHFLWASVTMEGRSAAAIATARKLHAALTPQAILEFPPVEEQVPVQYFALVRFGKFDQLLAEPAPAESQRYANGMWHHARGMAFAAKGRLDEARAERASLDALAADPTLQTLQFPAASAARLLALASQVLAAEIAEREGKYAEALAALEAASIIEREFNYTEPPPWYLPVKQMQGSMLLAMGRPADAEAAFLQDLVEQPENGWSLFGLAESLRAQGKPDDQARQRFAAAWVASDVTLEKPRF